MNLFGYFVAAFCALAAYIWAIVKLSRDRRALQKEEFDRTNEHGVLEFENFDASRKFNSRMNRNQFFVQIMAVPGGIVPLASIVVLIFVLSETF